MKPAQKSKLAPGHFRSGALLAAVLAILLAPVAVVYADGRESINLENIRVAINHDREDQRVARKIAEICRDEIPRLGAQLGLAGTAPLMVEIERDLDRYRSHLGAQMPGWGVAFALMGENVMVVDVRRATNAWNSLEKVIPHELSHLLVAQKVGGVRLPVWFLEGLAKWQAYEWSLIDSWQLMNVVWGSSTPDLWRLTDGYPPGEEEARAAYRVSYAAFTYLFGENTSELPAFLDDVARYGDFDLAFEDFWGEKTTAFYGRFHRNLERKYHSRLLFFQPGPLFSFLAVLFLVVIVKFSLRRRRKLKELERLDAGYPSDQDQRG